MESDNVATSSKESIGRNESELKRFSLQANDENAEPFYFESDTLALKNNPDYCCLLKTLTLLEGQRMKACEDIQRLIDLKERALSEPHKFLAQMTRHAQNGSSLSSSQATTSKIDKENSDKESEMLAKEKEVKETDSSGRDNGEVEEEVNFLGLPERQMVYVLPEINWNKYYDCISLDDLEAIKNQNAQRVHSLRQLNKMKQQQEEKKNSNDAESEMESRTKRGSLRRQASKAPNYQEPSVRSSNTTTTSTANSNSSNADKSRNQPWSVQEQRQLEEYLLEFPPEDNEAARWRKIADKLGTRTPLQVQSHVQKYFIKLAKAGLPIPGRMPNLKTYVTKKGTRGNRKSSLMRGACMAAGVSTISGIGSGRAKNNKILSVRGYHRRMVGRGVSLNEISSMWSSFNPPVTMNDDHDDHAAMQQHHHNQLSAGGTSSSSTRQDEYGNEAINDMITYGEGEEDEEEYENEGDEEAYEAYEDVFNHDEYADAHFNFDDNDDLGQFENNEEDESSENSNSINNQS